VSTYIAKRIVQLVIVLFIVSLLIGCLAPLWLILNLAVLLPWRQDLRKLPPLFQILAYSSLGLSVLYSFLMLVFLLFNGI